MGEKVTIMVLKVDLQCPCCYKKVKKIICKFPQIRDQVYNEKANTVTITVVCCNPEKIRDKLCCKGGKVIKSIEIKEPKEFEKPKEADKSQEPEKQKEPTKPKESEKPNEPEKSKVDVIEQPKESEKSKETPNPTPPNEPAPTPEPVTVPIGFPPVRICCGPCSEGYGGGPCYHGYGVPPPPQPCYDGYYGYGHSYGYDRPCHLIRCECYFSEENPGACAIM